MAELRIEGLRKNFGTHPVLSDLDLIVPAGEFVAILGPSGSGKTTLLRLVCGFERADGGTILLNQQTVSGPGVHLPPDRRRIGYVPQEGALFPHLSVVENIVFGLPRDQRRARYRVDELLEIVGLPASFANRAPQQLSGGQQQRVALARALAPQPALVLLDEPFSALDAALRVETRKAVADALSAAGATALLVTHDQSEALSMGHQVAVLWEGRLLQIAGPETLYRRPVTAELARFVGDAVLLPGIAAGGQVSCTLGTLPMMTDMPQGKVSVLLRPEQIRLGPSPRSHTGTADSSIRAQVFDIAFYGHDACVRLHLATDGSLLTARVPGHRCPAQGQDVGLTVEGEVATFARLS
ncbi:ABC transporter ATP-binding protein [Polaromonas jejuensis]|uniref:ABC transporter ATP-binding protein n=1 Tax=Polaromonas jejuensis TaxID=457502 RepID=A0ABW0QDL3_9BURK|nr:ABC transporter ATP-binding protein [Polaromonas jejuensis]